MKKKALYLGLAGFLVVVIGVGLLLAFGPWGKNQAPAETQTVETLTANELFELAESEWEQGEFRRAFVAYRKAAENHPDDVEIQWRFAQVCEDLNQFDQAKETLERAWELGKNDRDGLMMRLRLAEDSDPTRLRQKALEWIDDLTDGPNKQALRAEILFSTGEFEESRQIWIRLVESNTAPDIQDAILRAAMSYSSDEDWEGGLRWLVRAEELTQLDAESVLLKATFQALLDRADEAHQTLDAAAERFPNDADLAMRRIELRLVANEFEEVSGLLKAWESNYMAALDPEANLEDGPRMRMRLTAAFLASIQEDVAILNQLIQAQSNESEIAEAERSFYRALIADSAEGRTTTDVFASFEKAAEGLETEPLPRIVFAARLNADGAFARAESQLRQIRHPLYRRWPAFAIERARALDGLQQPWVADATLAELHSRGFYTPDSLRLAFDIQTRLGKVAEAGKIQELMARLITESPGSRYDSAITALSDPSRAEDAAKRLYTLVQSDEGGARQRLKALNALLNADRPAETLELLELNHGINPATVALLKGRAHELLGEFENAAAAFDAAVSLSPSWETISNQASYWSRQGNTARVRQILESAAAEFPNEAWPLNGLGRSYLEEENYSRAQELADQAWTKSTDKAATAGLMAEIYFKQRAWSEAELWAQRAVDHQIDPSSNPLVIYWLGVSILNQGDATRARSWLSQALELSENDPVALSAMISCEFALGAYTRVHALVNRYADIETPIPARVHALSIQAHIESGDFQTAREKIQTHREALGESSTALLMAMALEKENKTESALNALQPIIDSPEGLRLWVFIQARSGDTKAGVERALQTDVWAEADWVDMAGIALSREDPQSAIRCLEKLVEMKPESANHWNNLAWVRMESFPDQVEQSLIEVKKAMALDPNNASITDTYAEILLLNNDFETVLEIVEPWMAREATNAVWQFYAARASEALGDHERALSTYKECLTLAQTSIEEDIDISFVQERIDSLTEQTQP